jgi:NitT/TauT family transport system substrate-binding protein
MTPLKIGSGVKNVRSRQILWAALACVTFASPVGAVEAQTTIRLALPGEIDGSITPFLVAIDKGYFKAEHLNVTLTEPSQQGNRRNPFELLQKLSDDAADMVFGDINTFIRMRGQQNAPAAKAIFVVFDKPGYAVIGRKSRGIQGPKSLEGKKLGTPEGGLAFAYWKIFAKANGLDESKITFQQIGEAVREPMLAAGELDAVTGLSFVSYIDLVNRGVPKSDVTLMLMADYGLDLYGRSVIASAKFTAESPEAAKGFVRALAKGMRETIARPEAAIASVLKRNPDLQKEAELERLKFLIAQNIVTPETKKHGFGGADPARLEKSIEQVGSIFEFKAKPAAADIFDGSFLPSAAHRRTN